MWTDYIDDFPTDRWHADVLAGPFSEKKIPNREEVEEGRQALMGFLQKATIIGCSVEHWTAKNISLSRFGADCAIGLTTARTFSLSRFGADFAIGLTTVCIIDVTVVHASDYAYNVKLVTTSTIPTATKGKPIFQLTISTLLSLSIFQPMNLCAVPCLARQSVK
jgi:hypothetical protein